MAGQSVGTIFVELDLDSSRYVGAQKRLLQDATATTLNIESNFKKLGIKSSAEFDLLRARAENAFERIKNSSQVTANDIVRAEKAKTEQLKALNEQQYGSQQSLLSKMKENWLAVAAVITGAIYTIRKAWDLMNMAAQAEQARESFKNLADSYGSNSDRIIESLRKASAYTIDTMKLIQSAGTAMLFGINPEKISQLMEIARATSRITGQTVAKSFDDIALAVGRQSKKILDNLGILVSIEDANKKYAESLGITGRQLTDVEKREAFLNATLVEGEKIMQRLGTQTRTTAEWFQSFGAFVENAKVALGAGLIEVIKKVTIGFSWLGIAFNSIMADMTSFFSKDLEAHFRSAVAISEKFIKEIENLKQETSAGIPRGMGESEISGSDITTNDKKKLEDITDFWRIQYEQRYEIQSNALQAMIELDNQHLEESRAMTSDFWQFQIQGTADAADRAIKIQQQQAKYEKELRKQGLDNLQYTFVTLMNLSQGHNRAIFEVMKAASIANAIVSTYAGAANAMRDVPYPYNFLAAASVIAYGLAQVQQIRSQSFDSASTGGAAGGAVSTTNTPTLTEPIATQPTTEQPEQRGTVNIYVQGDILGDKASMEYLAESLSEYVEKYDVRLVASHAKKAESMA